MCSVAVEDKSNVIVPLSDATRTEFANLVTNCGSFEEKGDCRLSITGGDRVRWLNGMITNNVRDLPQNQGIYAFLLNPQGHILGDLYAYNRGDSLLVETDPDQKEKIFSTFDRYIIMDDVELTDITEQSASIQVAGPKALEALWAIGIEVPELRNLQFADLAWRGQPVTVVRHDNPAVDSYQLWIPPGARTEIQPALANAAAKPVGPDAIELLRIGSGVPRYGQDIRERDLPQETEQTRALHFSKGCYIGQEIVERIRSRGAVHRTFTGFEVHATLPQPGAKIQSGGKDVGEITSAATLPLDGGELRVALGYLRREFAVPGKELQADGAQLSVATLPFKKIFPAKDPTNHA